MTNSGDSKRQTTIFVLAVLGVIFVQVSIATAVYFLLPGWPERGQFGDVFGAANALFSGLAFAGLIYTIHLQRLDLGLQRTELELTRQELKRSADAQREQAEAARKSTRLAAAEFLLGHYRAEMAKMRDTPFKKDDARQPRMMELTRREAALRGILDKAYYEITETQEENT